MVTKQIRQFLLASLFVGFAVIAQSVRADDIATVQQRAIAKILADPAAQSVPVSTLLSSLQSNGSWSDVVYTDTGTTTWLPQTHLNRLLDMARAWSTVGGSMYHSASLQTAIDKAYDYWISIDPQSSNWWWNQIGAPTTLSQAMLLVQSTLTTTEMSSGVSRLSRAVTGGTGENLVWLATVNINSGLMTKNTTQIKNAFTAIGNTVAITTGEGVNRDYSFFQHGNQLYNGGYGMDFGVDVPRIAAEGAGTSFAFTDAQEQLIVNYLLDAQQWFSRGDTFDYLTTGRVITRNGNASMALDLLQPVADAITFGGYRLAELQAMQTRLNAAATTHTADPTLALSGHRHFWRSDMTVQQRPAWYASVAMTSTRVHQPEVVNNEGLLSRHQGDGVNLIMRSGNEYDDVFPVWDWRRLPGTTTEQGTYSLLPTNGAGATTFVGGVSDGKYGASAMDYKFVLSGQSHVLAKKSWFFFDNEEVALGAGISAPDPAATANVITTLNQTLQNGNVTYSTGSGSTTISSGTVSPSSLKWVYQDGVGYFFPTPATNATIMAKAQTGTWKSINTNGSTATVSKNVFSLQVNHGIKPTNAGYSYVVVPNTTAAAMDNYSALMPISILRNDSTVQAVRQTAADITQAAFYAPATLQVKSGLSMTPDQACLLMLVGTPTSLEITASNPIQSAMALHVQMSIELSGPGAVWNPTTHLSTLTFNLPGGDMGGSSVVQNYSIVVPEPASVLLIGLAGSMVLRRRRRGAN